MATHAQAMAGFPTLDSAYYDGEYTKDIQLIASCELPPVAGHVAAEYRNCMIVWGGYCYASNSQLYRPANYLYIYPYSLSGEFNVWIKYKVDKGEYPLERSASSGFVENDHLYIFGGNVTKRDENGVQICSPSNDLHKLSLISGTWTRIVQKEGELLPTDRDKTCGFSTENGLYLFGGYGPSLKAMLDRSPYFGQSAEFHDDENSPNSAWNNQLIHFDWNKWNRVEQGGNVPSQRAAASMTLVMKENAAYLFGGRHANARLNDLYKLDLKTMMWTMIEFENLLEQPVGRSWGTLTAYPHGDYIMLFGGLSKDNKALSDRHKLQIKKGVAHVSAMEVEQRVSLWHSTVFVKNALLTYGGMKDCPNSPAPCISYLETVQLAPDSLKEICLRELIFSTPFKTDADVRKLTRMLPFLLKAQFLLLSDIVDFQKRYYGDADLKTKRRYIRSQNIQLQVLFNAMNI